LPSPVSRPSAWRALALVSLLTFFGLAVHGFHPYVEDGGLYVAGIEKLLNQRLFPLWTDFVTEHLRFSIFAPVVARLVRFSHIPLGVMMFLLYLAGIWLTLWAAGMLLRRVTKSGYALAGGLTLLTCWLTLPIAGTSLMLMDPYVTARTFSTPLVLFALSWTLDAIHGQRMAWFAVVSALLVAAAIHPLMAAYGVAAVVVLSLLGAQTPSIRRFSPSMLLGVALLVAATLQMKAPLESPAYIRIALTRYYWFPFAWQWYEQLGLVAPILLLWWFAHDDTQPRAWKHVARTGIVLALLSLAVALLFARQDYATHLVARLQPLRAFQTVYELMILLLGARLGERALRHHAWRWALLIVSMGGMLFFVQRDTFPNSTHVELPWKAPTNPWEQAFLWARENTSSDALFALDAHYITHGKHEDAQCFRAIAERSALADYSKDGGEASITPDLTTAWTTGEQAQTGLEVETDSLRLQHLQPLGVSWVVLELQSRTGWSCPYQNGVVKICRLP